MLFPDIGHSMHLMRLANRYIKRSFDNGGHFRLSPHITISISCSILHTVAQTIGNQKKLVRKCTNSAPIKRNCKAICITGY
jgi:hypothetical protein